MNFFSSKKQSSVAIVGALMITLGVERSAVGATFNPAPLLRVQSVTLRTFLELTVV